MINAENKQISLEKREKAFGLHIKKQKWKLKDKYKQESKLF